RPVRTVSTDVGGNFQLAYAVNVLRAKPLHEVPWKMALDFPEVSHRRFVRLEPRRSFFHICQPIIRHPKPVNQRGQTQTLKHQRRENDAESNEQNVITTGKSAAVRESHWHRKSRRQRNNAAHSSPRQDGGALPFLSGIF